SHLLLWQAASSEFIFLPAYWPAFPPEIFRSSLETLASHDRRFGGISSQAAAVGTCCSGP
ncbi:undecaprenyl diphosphate synthase family protein, partial [Rhizobium ruizarguesonis]